MIVHSHSILSPHDGSPHQQREHTSGQYIHDGNQWTFAHKLFSPHTYQTALRRTLSSRRLMDTRCYYLFWLAHISFLFAHLGN